MTDSTYVFHLLLYNLHWQPCNEADPYLDLDSVAVISKEIFEQKEEAIMNGWLKENAQKPSEMTEKDVMDNQKPSNVMENESKTVTETEKPSFPYIFFTEITHFCDSIKCRLSVGLLLALPNGHTPCIEAKKVRRQTSLLRSVA